MCSDFRWHCHSKVHSWSTKISVVQTYEIFIVQAQVKRLKLGRVRLGCAEIGSKLQTMPASISCFSISLHLQLPKAHFSKQKTTVTHDSMPRFATQFKPVHISCPLTFHQLRQVLLPSPNSRSTVHPIYEATTGVRIYDIWKGSEKLIQKMIQSTISGIIKYMPK